MNHNSSKPNKTEYNEIKLVNQGTYGCVYKPEITCDGEVGNAAYVSKIQLNSESIQHEEKIGSLILENIPFSQQYFAPIIKVCPVSMSIMNQSEQSKCNIIDKTKPSKYSSSKIRFIGDKDISEYLKSLPPDANILIKKIQSTYYHILTSLKKINDCGIIHYDIKEDNVLYDENNHSPIIIDFGISFINSDIATANNIGIFYSDKYYPYWCIDIYILSNVIKILDTEVTETLLIHLFDSFYENLYTFMENNGYVIQNEERDAFKLKYDDYFKPFIGEPWQKVYNHLYTKQVYQSWDNYSCSIMYLLIVTQLYYEKDGPLSRNKDNLPKPFTRYPFVQYSNNTNIENDTNPNSIQLVDAGSVIENDYQTSLIKQPIIQVYAELWKNIIFAMPEERLDCELTMRVFLNI